MLGLPKVKGVQTQRIANALVTTLNELKPQGRLEEFGQIVAQVV